MKILGIRKGFRVGNRVVTGRYFGQYVVDNYDDDDRLVGHSILSEAEIRHAIHDETGKFYDTLIYEEEEE